MELLDKRERTRLSRFIALILRHKPEVIGIKLDDEGWVDIDELVEKINKKNKRNVAREHIEEVARLCPKKRYTIDGNRIRASQGHSLSDVKIDFKEVEPPEFLYHGTSHSFINNIMKVGLRAMSRQYVHISPDFETAMKVGKRRDKKPVILQIESKKAFEEGIVFYLSDNNVYLVENMPAKYLKIYKG